MKSKYIKSGKLSAAGTAYKKLFLYTLLILLPLSLFAQAGGKITVAIFPFWGDDQETVRQFGEELQIAMDQMANYRPSPVNMNPALLPPDVPEGGFPPFVCPSPSQTRDMPYALTGEIAEDPDTGGWSLRLYLWQMSDTRLIFSDRLTAYDKETCRMILPGLLDWIFSWLQEPQTPITVSTGGDSRVVYYAPAVPDKWLHLGLKFGYPVRLHGNPVLDGAAKFGNNGYYKNLEIGASLFLQAFSFLGFQLEGILDMNTVETDPFKALTFSLPLMLRFIFKNDTAVYSILAGAYAGFLGNTKNDFYFNPNLPLGLTAGIQYGNKAGPGNLFFDVRWAMDLTDTIEKATDDRGFRRHSLSFCFGYEFGFIKKK